MAALLELKGERRGKGMPILVPDERVLSRLVEIDATSRRLIHKFWPGPLTLVLPAKEAAQGVVHEGRVGVRMTRAPLAQALLKHWDGPLTGTSANPSGRPAATSAQQVRDYFGGRVLVIDGGATPGGMPSTVIRPTGGSFEVLRVGVLSVEDLRAALGGSVSEKDA
jgi:L-threonylcarbamoyladenylate synthase